MHRTVGMLVGLAQILFWPWAAWRLAILLDPGAQLVGGYLLLSPMLAFGIVAFLYSLRIKSYGEIHEELSRRAAALAEATSLRGVTVRLYRDEQNLHPVSNDGKDLLVDASEFGALSEGQQRFALALALTHLEDSRSRRISRYLYWAACALPLCILAALNLWLILIIHSAAAIGLFWKSLNPAWYRKQLVERDTRAARIAKDLEGAVSFIKWQTQRSPSGAYAFTEDRLSAVKAALS